MAVDALSIHIDGWRSALRRAENDPEYAEALRRYLELTTGMPTELRRFGGMLLPYTRLLRRFYIVVNGNIYFITDRICRSPRRISPRDASIVAHDIALLNAREAYFCGNYVAYRTTDLPGYVVDYVGPYYIAQLREATSIPATPTHTGDVEREVASIDVGDIETDTL
jgi:hypothetical protein